jgi:hypothetical protein
MSDKLGFKWKDIARSLQWALSLQGLLMAKNLPKADMMKVFSVH